MKCRLIVLVIFLKFFGTGCVDQIELNIPADRTDAFYVDGSLILGDERSYVELTFSRVYDFTNESREYIQNANVQVFDRDGNSIKLERHGDTSFAYEFEFDSPFFPQLGESYMLRIELNDNRIIQSEFSTIAAVTAPSEFKQEIIERRFISNSSKPGDVRITEELQLSISTDIPEAGALVWLTNLTYKVNDTPFPYSPEPSKTCYVTERISINRINVLGESDVANNSVVNFPIISDQITFEYNEGLYFIVRQRAVDRETSEYINLLERLINVGESVFDDRPGELSVGNISVEGNSNTQVYGHFYAAQEYIARIKADETLFEARESYCPPPLPCGGSDCCWGICCNCLNHPNSTIIKPIWWID